MPTKTDISEVPKYQDIVEELERLREPFTDFYRRHNAKQVWPDYDFIIDLSDDMVNQSGRTQSTSATSSQSFDFEPIPGADDFPYRRSSILGERGIRVPEDATEEEENIVNEAAIESAEVDLHNLKNQLDRAIADSDLLQTSRMVDRLDHIVEMMDGVHDQNGSNFEKIEDLFESWDGSDSDRGLDLFGDKIRVAVTIHRNMANDMCDVANKELVSKVTAQVGSAKAVQEAVDKVAETMTEYDYSARLTFGSITYTAKGMTGVMTIAEHIAVFNGGEPGDAGNALNDVLDNLIMEYKEPLQGDDISEINNNLWHKLRNYELEMRTVRENIESDIDSHLREHTASFSGQRSTLIPGHPD